MKTITVVFYDREFAGEWTYDLDEQKIQPFFDALNAELNSAGVQFDFCNEPNITLRVNGYGDLLNSIRIRSPEDGFSSLCLGQFIGPSPDTDLLADIKRGVRRVAFSPESIVPAGGDAICHNCGCGC
ncbi:hypothetical protein HTZ97_08380 [Desulfuromonas acetoxidans]|uniref:Uncharacterized protein n=1 Tax=Desulfuromonas acetoxidans (strain DSM 684 / 11070) TaxID=281689 RepID=Q1K0H1_DESA6|nr:hypothetical protein [Desulfuromonas acetoxidans]EAT15970.1 conserved hypothetical protein [Desulfuromonas acetoxidans DSM 684]MBF0644132.1 hypothetical protein [Desulfuromonas acetoxidans]NVD24570.1 hypothetical protein [Desulfuromonas acetoxidans]NVE16480.1 hypothetical protein [Desulfuromonas acetoxidans]